MASDNKSADLSPVTFRAPGEPAAKSPVEPSAVAPTSVNSREQIPSPLGVYQEGMAWNPVEQVIMERRSIRRFKREPLSDGMIRRILEAGRFAPSAGNFQPWRFIVVKSPEILAEMEKDARRLIKILMSCVDYTDANWFRRLFLLPLAKIFIKLNPNTLHPVPMGLMSQIAKDKATVFHGAPTLILLVEDTRGVSCPPTDIGICGQNMILAAHSMGAGSCWIGLIKVLMYMPKWKKMFGIKYPYRLNDCIALGRQLPNADGPVPRETQLVEWFEGKINDKPRIERQGE
jgi:nitroreductase